MSIFSEDARRVAPPPVGAILHIQAPLFPAFRFEWHPSTKTVYLARLGRRPVIGEAIAHAVETHGAAQNVVLIWLRGYRAGHAEQESPHAPE